jgi:hypothetical protein
MKKQHFLIAIVLYVCAVFYLASTTPISPHEAKILYTSNNIVSFLMQKGDALFHHILGLRLFFIFCGFLSVFLFYHVSLLYLKSKKESYLATTLFMMLPGILTATTLVNVSILVLPLVLLFVWLYEKGYFLPLIPILLALFFVHEASVIFFVALLLYGIFHHDRRLVILSSAFLASFVYLTKGITIGGRPSGHFLEIFGLYATLFSPFVFLYFFYAMYRILLREEKNLLWYISFTAFAFSLLLSIRQRVYITDFAPYVMGAVVLMLNLFNHSLYVRLPEFQQSYRRIFSGVIALLVINALLIIFHQSLFLFLKDPSRHFAYRIYKPYFLVEQLKAKHLTCYQSVYGRERYQLKYYNFLPCSQKSP